MLILNTTNIPESSIRLVAGIVKPPNIPEINEISLRNKSVDAKAGNLGMFYDTLYKITLNVPRDRDRHIIYRPQLGDDYRVEDINEWLAAIIGHEYKHAWQSIHEKQRFHNPDSKTYIEYRAEEYETEALTLWQEYRDSHNITEVKAARNVRYRDFRK